MARSLRGQWQHSIVEVQPTTSEARRIVASLVTCWVASSFLSVADESVSLPAFVIAFAAMICLYWTLFAVGGRETGHSARDYMGWRIPFRGHTPTGREGWTILLKLVNLRWWSSVVKTGWPTTLTTAALCGSLVSLVALSVIGPFVV